MTNDPREPLLTIRGLGKSYAAPVLHAIDLDLWPGEVLALIGGNGAGKTTLARIVSGLTAPDRGAMSLAGRPHRPTSKADAEASGVQIVPQEPQLIGTLSVAENLMLGRWPSRGGLIRFGRLHQAARSALAVVGLHDLPPDTMASDLGVGQQQLVAIASALARPCRVLILDEPTAALADPQVDLLFGQIDRLKAGGLAVVYISHRLEELRRIADRVAVLRDGQIVATRPAAGLGVEEAVRLMVGTDSASRRARAAREPGPAALRVSRLHRGDKVRDISLTLHRGEVLGLAGLVGSGRTELLRAIYGADPADSGLVQVGDGQPGQFRQPREAVHAGMGLVPEDRKAEGLLMPVPISANLTLARLHHFRRWAGRLDLSAERAASTDLARRVQLLYRSIHQPAAELSGGNQQKVVLGRWLLGTPRVLLLDEPTRGVDVAAQRAIHGLIDELAERGQAILVASSDLEELMALCDRIAVLSAGRLVATFERGEWSRQALLTAAFQEHLGGGFVPSPEP